jgi:hypothetical protein
MSKERYAEVLKRPWKYGHGWGMDEEVISIANWLCGGTNELVNEEVAHLCRGQSDVPYRNTKEQNLGIWANRLQMIDMFPMSNEDRKELQSWLLQNPVVKNGAGLIGNLIDTEAIKELREYYGSQDRTFDMWKDRFIKQKEYTMTIQTLRTKCKKAGLAFTMKMTKVELNAMLNDPNAPKKVVKEVKKRTPNIVVVDEGIKCPACQHRYDHKVLCTFSNSNRRMKCLCGNCFVLTREGNVFGQ